MALHLDAPVGAYERGGQLVEVFVRLGAYGALGEVERDGVDGADGLALYALVLGHEVYYLVERVARLVGRLGLGRRHHWLGLRLGGGLPFAGEYAERHGQHGPYLKPAELARSVDAVVAVEELRHVVGLAVLLLAAVGVGEAQLVAGLDAQPAAVGGHGYGKLHAHAHLPGKVGRRHVGVGQVGLVARHAAVVVLGHELYVAGRGKAQHGGHVGIGPHLGRGLAKLVD